MSSTLQRRAGTRRNSQMAGREDKCAHRQQRRAVERRCFSTCRAKTLAPFKRNGQNSGLQLPAHFRPKREHGSGACPRCHDRGRHEPKSESLDKVWGTPRMLSGSVSD
jgi:hypothetical protein